MAAQGVGDGLAGDLLDDGVVGSLARAEEVHVHAGHDLELHVGRAAADGGHVQLRRGPLLKQRVEVGRGIPGELRVDHGVHVKEGLQLDEHDVRAGEVVVRVEARAQGNLRGLRFLDLLQNLLHNLGRVFVGLADAGRAEGVGKAGGEAVVVVGVHAVAEGLRDVAKLERQQAQAEGEAHQRRHIPHGVGIVHPAALRRPGEHGDQPHDQPQYGDAAQYDLRPAEVDRRHAHDLRGQDEVAAHQRLGAVAADHVIGEAQPDPQRRDRPGHRPAVLDQLGQAQRGQHHQPVHQEVQRALGEVGDHPHGAALVEALHEQRDHQGHQHQLQNPQSAGGGVVLHAAPGRIAARRSAVLLRAALRSFAVHWKNPPESCLKQTFPRCELHVSAERTCIHYDRLTTCRCHPRG